MSSHGKILLLLECLVLLFLRINSQAQPQSVYNNFLKFSTLYNLGDFQAAEECMFSVLNSETELPEDYIISALNNIGLTKKSSGLYAEALEYYKRAESYFKPDDSRNLQLASIYSNRSRVHTLQRSYYTAIEYLEKAIRIYLAVNDGSMALLFGLSTSYLNLGINHYETGNYSLSLQYLKKSDELKSMYDLPEKGLTLLNLAKTNFALKQYEKADFHFKKCFETIKHKHGEDYIRLADVNFSYAEFLSATGDTAGALGANLNALRICLKSYGTKHPLVALAYKNIADFHSSQNNYDSALEYYQKSLISLEPGFENDNIYSNPSAASAFIDTRLTDILKGKAKAMYGAAGKNIERRDKIRLLEGSLSTTMQAINLIERMSGNYFTEESRLYLSDREKSTYTAGLETAEKLFRMTGCDTCFNVMYNFAQRAKASVLLNGIAVRELLMVSGISDSLREEHNRLESSIRGYSRLLLGEVDNNISDTTMVTHWKDELFYLNRKFEELNGQISKRYPQYRQLFEKTRPLPAGDIRKKLRKDETILDYLVSGSDKTGEDSLYIFVISRKNVDFRKIAIGPDFVFDIELIRNGFSSPGRTDFTSLTSALFRMYGILVKPIEPLIADDKLIIIPDEEISWLPFDALLSESPPPGKGEFEGLDHLINKYSISYCYSSSLLVKNSAITSRVKEVLSFVPHYDQADIPGSSPSELPGAASEVKSIYRWFRGSRFEGEKATRAGFLSCLRKPALLHLALHSVQDSLDSRYSYLLFENNEEGKLYNYEISLSEVRSPLVVLSSCNSGTGTMYNSEGVLSLARSFILAGSPSVLRTSWSVNDEVSAGIITDFYKGLSAGKTKDEALRKAKLNFLNEHSPAYRHPYYWASYEVLGSSAPVRGRFHGIVSAASAGTILLLLRIYLRRRKISAARLL